jgi:hypothetical protein
VVGDADLSRPGNRRAKNDEGRKQSFHGVMRHFDLVRLVGVTDEGSDSSYSVKNAGGIPARRVMAAMAEILPPTSHSAWGQQN